MSDLAKYKMWQDQFVYDMIGCGESAPLVDIDVATSALEKMPDGIIAQIIGSIILQNLSDHREDTLRSAIILANRLAEPDFANDTIDRAMF